MSAFSIGLSGMLAAQSRLDAAAGRIARWPQSSEWRPGATRPPGATAPAVEAFSAPAAVDLATDLVGQLDALRAVQANLRTVVAADEAIGTLIDTFA